MARSGAESIQPVAAASGRPADRRTGCHGTDGCHWRDGNDFFLVRLTLPDAKPVKSVRLLRAGQDLPVRQTGNVVAFTIPRLEGYEVAALEV